MQPYVATAVDSEIDSLRATSSGRACATFKAAAALGGFVGAGELDRTDTERILLAVALETGLPEREAVGHIRRGIRRGERTPRSVPVGRSSYRSRLARRPIAAVDPILSELEPRRPPKIQIDAMWDAAVPIRSDPDACAWFHQRFQEQATSFIDLTETWDLGRVLPLDHSLPSWAWSRGGAWTRTGHRLLFRLWDDVGKAVSLRARSVDPCTTPKSLAPSGFSIKGLVLADPLGMQLLSGHVPDWWEPREIIIAEGEPDWLTWAARQNDSDPQGPACFGIEAGAWSQQIAGRIPDGARVVVRTHHDPPGERYAQQIARSLRGRCRVFRSRAGEKGAPR